MPSPIGHALAGVSAAWLIDLVPGNRAWRTAPAEASFYERAGGDLTLLCAGLAAAPDFDLIFGVHRTFSHSIGAVIFVGLFAAAMAANRGQPIARVTTMCAAAYGSHLLLDWMAVDLYPPAGIQALWPFSSAWYISGWDVFLQTERSHPTGTEGIQQNLAAIEREVEILLPLAYAVWLVRVEALARLAPELSGRDHPAE
jgi:hypothetical protein